MTKSVKKFNVLLAVLMLLAAVTFTPTFAQAAPVAEAQPSQSAKVDKEAETSVSSDGKSASFLTSSPESSVEEKGFMPGKVSSLEGTEGDLGFEQVIGADNRYRVENTKAYPARAIVHISLNFGNKGGGCTGFLIGPDTVATAGHCVFSKEYKVWATNVVVTPGRNAGTAPFGTCGAKLLHSVKGWTQNLDSGYDYGAIKLNCKIGNTVGWFGYRSTPAIPVSLTGTGVSIAGYPGDKAYGTMWKHSGSILGGINKVYYPIDTYKGQSGAPVYQENYEKKGPYAVAIHTNSGSTLNAGTRIRPAVFDNLKAWKNS